MSKKIPVVPRTESIKRIFRFVKNPIPILTQFSRDYGDTYSFYVGGLQKAISTTNPKIIQHILQKNHRNYRKSEIQTVELAAFAGKGLLTSDGPYWLQQRRLIQPGFHRNKLAALVDIMLEVIDNQLNELDQLADSAKPFDISDKMMEFAFRIVAKSLFTTSVSETELKTLATNITIIQEFLIKKIRQPYLRWYFSLFGKEKATHQIAEDSKQIILKIINERRHSKDNFDDLLDMLLAARYEDTQEGMTDQQLLDEALILFVAGHETSANALSWIWYLLAQHPEVVQKLRTEINTVLGDQSPSAGTLMQMDYTRQVIEETMRLYPPAWITDRLANEEDEIEGWIIPKDAMVIAFIYGVHHSPELWDQPELFNPDRFSKENKKGQPSYSYLPFRRRSKIVYRK